MSEWLQQFLSELEQIKQGIPTDGNPGRSLAKNVLRVAAEAPDAHPIDWNAFAGSGKDLGLVDRNIETAKSAGLGLLDLLSRGTYASAGLAKNVAGNLTKELAQDTDGVTPLDFILAQAKAAYSPDNVGGNVAAAAKGVWGSEKNTYQDVLKDVGMEDGAVRGVTGFALDVALDPTTYVGAGLVKGAVKSGFAAVGKEVPKLGRAKNPLIRATTELEEQGATRVPTAATEQTIKVADPDQLELPFEIETPKAPVETPVTPRPIDQLAEELDPVVATKVDNAAPLPKITLQPDMATGVENAIRAVSKRDLRIPKSTTKKASYVPRVRQLTLNKQVLSEAAKIVSKTRLRGPARAALMYDTAMPMLHAAERTFKDQGIPLILGKSDSGLPFSVHDFLQAMPRDTVERIFFNGATMMDVTQIADIAEATIKNAMGHIDDVELKDTVRKLVTTDTRLNGTSNYNRVFKNRGENAQVVHINKLVERLKESQPAIIDRLKTNSAELGAKFGDDAQALTMDVVDRFNRFLDSPSALSGAVVEAVVNLNKFVEESAKVIPNTSPIARGVAERALTEHVASRVAIEPAQVAARASVRHAAARTDAEAAGVRATVSRAAQTEARAIAETDNLMLDLGTDAEFSWGVAIFRAFSPHLGNENVRKILIARQSVGQTRGRVIAKQLAKINASHSQDEIKSAFSMLQTGEQGSNAATAGIQQAIADLFADSGKYGIMARNGISPARLNSKLGKFGVPKHLRLTDDLGSNSWVEWAVEDPLDLISKYNAAVSHIIAENELGAEITRIWGSATPKPGYVKIGDSRGKSKLAKLIDTNLHYPEDIARQFHMLDKTLDELAKPNSDNELLKVLDTVIHRYKSAVTIYRPGHHIRNMIGDTWLSFMDGVKVGSYTKAAQVLATRPSNYGDIDAIRAMEAASLGSSTRAAKHHSVVSKSFRGETRTYNPDEVFKLAFRHGILTDYSVIEDLNFGKAVSNENVVTSRLSAPFGGKVHKVAASASEYREHYIRLAHFLHALDETPMHGRNFDEALHDAARIASDRVRKWHPDGSDLSKFERTTMRRSFLFYSWVRKAIPLVIESAVTRPGRFMVYPKAMQNVAEANGIDLNGFGNAFPDDQLFPDYFTESTQGPQFGESGDYSGIRPGIPSMDVLDDFFASPSTTLGSVMGSTTPLARIPYELATGAQVQTGVPINDMSEYVDRQIPGGTYVDKLTGRSLSSGFSQELNVPEGNEDVGNVPLETLLNWLTGAGFTRYSKPSSIRQAKREETERRKG